MRAVEKMFPENFRLFPTFSGGGNYNMITSSGFQVKFPVWEKKE